jgi:PPOX class probable F420-dependent enzyme
MAANTIPASLHDLFASKALANLAVITKSGLPMVSPVWVDLDGNNVLINSEAKRVKSQNMGVGSKVALSIVDPTNPFRYIGVQGEVVERREAGADAHIDKLSQRYTGKSPYPWRQPGDQRVLFVIKPIRVKARE